MIGARRRNHAHAAAASENAPTLRVRAHVTLHPAADEPLTRRQRRAQRRAQRTARRHADTPQPTGTTAVLPPIRATRTWVPPQPNTPQRQVHVPAQPRAAPPRVQYPEALPGVLVNYTQDTVEGLAIVGCQHRRTPEVQQSEAAALHDLADLLEPVTPFSARPKDTRLRIRLPSDVDVGIVPRENALNTSGNPVRPAPPAAPKPGDYTRRVLNRGYIVVTDDFASSNPALNVSETVTMYQTAFDGAPLPLAVDPIRGEASMEVERYVALAAEDYRPVFRRRDSWSVYGRATYQMNARSPSVPSSQTLNRTLVE